jgi:ribose transport system permease protein
VVAVILALVLRFARFGRYTYAIGSNPFAARAAGINVRRHIALVYIVAGFLGGLVGMYFLIRLGSGFPTTGENVNLSAIACVVIGGIALTGGSGSVLGTLLGCAILTVVNDGLIAINVPPTWNQVVVGVIIMAAAGLQALRGKLSLSKFFTTRSSGSSK